MMSRLHAQLGRPIRYGGCWATLLLGMLAGSAIASGPEDGAGVLALWQTRSVNGVPGEVGVSGYDADSLKIVVPALSLPGNVPAGRIEISAGDPGLAGLITRDATVERSYLTFLSLDHVVPVVPRPLLLGAGEQPVGLQMAPSDVAGVTRVAVLTRSSQGFGGRVIQATLQIDGAGLDVRGSFAADVPGRPRTLDVDWERNLVFVSGDAASGVPYICSFPLGDGLSEPSMKYPDSSMIRMLEDRASLLMAGGEYLVLASSGFGIPDRPGSVGTVVELFSTKSLEATGEPVVLPGSVSTGGGLTGGEARRFWVTTYAPSGAFAYATELDYSGDRLTKTAEESIAGADNAPRVTVSDSRTALVSGTEVRIRKDRDPAPVRYEFEGPADAALWVGNALLAASGSQLVRVDPESGVSVDVGDRAPGSIIDVAPMRHADADRARGPRVRYPLHVHLEPGMPGREEFVLPLIVPEGRRVVAKVDSSARSWLRLRRDELADGSPVLRFAVDGGQPSAEAGDALQGSVAVTLLDSAGKPVVGSEAWLTVSASSPALHPFVVQWHAPESGLTLDDRDISALARILAGPPLHFSHRRRTGPLVTPPSASMVVLGVDAVLEGALTRQVLLDYVARGGGLLLIGRHAPETASEGLRRWLEPLGFVIDTSQHIDETFEAPSAITTGMGLSQLAVAAGCYVGTPGPMDVRVPEDAGSAAALAMRRYGFGRIAVLASSSVLEPKVVEQTGGRRFVRALFGWIAGRGHVTRDSDFDGLTDDTEDANGNGRVDRGETSFVRADTDGDELPDGVEDANLNGRIDEGETDPVSFDTDADGIPDGADLDPLPAAGTPVLAGVMPASGPAQGGTMVALTGQNLPVNPEVWFGEQQSLHVVRLDSERILAATPHYPVRDPGTVDVRVGRRIGPAEGLLPGGFTYTERSRAHLFFDSISRVRRTRDAYEGSMDLVLDVGKVRVGYVGFYVWIEPGLVQLELTLQRSEQLAAAGRTVNVRPFSLKQNRVYVGDGEPLRGRVTLGTLSWRLVNAPAPPESLHLFYRVPDIRAQWGGPLAADLEEARVSLEPPTGPEAPPGGAIDSARR